MGLFDSQTPTPVTLSGTSKTTAPQYLTDYLTQLAQTGQQQLGSAQIAPLNQNLQTLYSPQTATSALTSYQPIMASAAEAGRAGAAGITDADIRGFYNPYEQDVINRMGEQSALNVQRSMLPALKSAFAGTGGFGSQRYAGALGQAMADVQTGLAGEQAKYRSQGYQNALEAALKEKGYQTQAASALGNIGAQEATAGSSYLKNLGDIGTQELAYEQSKIEAPITRAQNVSKLLQGYQVPTSTEEKKQALPGAYPPSPLSQIAGLGSLLGSGFNSPSGWGNQLMSALGGALSKVNLNNLFSSGTGSYQGNLAPSGDALGAGNTPAYDQSGTYIGYYTPGGQFVEMD